MVPTVKAKNRKIPLAQLDYLIHIQEIKPWPPSQSLRTLRSVIIQWELGDRNSGVTSQVVPSLGSGSGVSDGMIEFNESFKLPVTLLRELSGKLGDKNTFQKNCIEFNLVEPRRDKTVKGQVLGTAIIDLAEYGVLKESLCISAAINCKRSYRNTAQPYLFLKIEPIDRIRRGPLMRISSIKKNGVDSVSALMSEEYAEEAETASCTDDDVTSHSSPSSSPVESNGGSLSKNAVYPEVPPGLESVKAGCEESEEVSALTHDFSKSDEKQFALSTASSNGGSSRASSNDLSSWFAKSAVSSAVQVSSTYGPHEVTETDDGSKNIIVPHDYARNDIRKEVFHGVDCVASHSTGMSISASPLNKVASFVNITEKLNAIDSFYSSIKDSVDHDENVCSTKGIHKAPNSNLIENDLVNSGNDKCQENGEERQIVEESENGTEEQSGINFTDNGTWMDVSFRGALISPNREDKHRHVRSVRSSLNSSKTGVMVSNGKSIQKDMQNGVQCSTKNDLKDNKVHTKDTRTILSDSKLQHLKQRVKKLEWELTEAAAIEAALYSVVAEHGSSTNKVHAPARRLSRFIIHATKVNSQSGRATAAKSSVSGLILVTKACGNDVPRLTFWLSNSILLRAIITESLEEEQLSFSVNPVIRKKPLKWQSPPIRNVDNALSDNWEDPQTLETALEKVEEWIVARIIESIWWQTLTPHMQSGAAKAIKMSGDEDQLNFSLELWKKAFRDAYERICPVRADGHECGCLPELSRMIMEQCVARLDVAMLNAILRDSGDDIPTDPVSDPISDAQVLPIPAGKASFGAGAQLKSAIGNWSRWLSDLLGLDHDPSLEDVNADESGDDEKNSHGTTLKSFHLLNELSDLMMLPKDMLLSRTIRKEVCPTFGPILIRRVVNIFVRDEFCPDPIPNIVLESLNSEDSFDAEENTVVNFPYPTAQIDYIPPLPSDIGMSCGGSNSKLTRSGSLLLTKSHTSDDELDVLDSPLSCIYTDSTHNNSYQKKHAWTSNENANHDSMRYQLLRKIWNCSN